MQAMLVKWRDIGSMQGDNWSRWMVQQVGVHQMPNNAQEVELTLKRYRGSYEMKSSQATELSVTARAVKPAVIRPREFLAH